VKHLVTGMNGTVAPALAKHLVSQGADVVSWDRAVDPPTDEPAVRAFIARHRPDWVCHVATGAPEWAEWIARACAGGGPGVPRLLWTGSVSVFGPQAKAPIGPDATPDATDDYGKYKIECERRVLAACPNAVVARLGWQIGEAAGSNTMTDFLTRKAAEGAGTIEASTRWIPSCAWLPDTAAALAALMRSGTPGLFHLEGNTAGKSFVEIAAGIARMLRQPWNIVPTDAPAMDNRMRDDRVSMGQVADRLHLGRP
jgi:dTDP-4-dehydrorhamnose reductase